LTKNGAGTLTLAGTNTYTGATTINGGVLSVGTIGNGGVASNLGQAAVAATNLVLGGGTLQYTGATASTNRNFTLTAATTSTIEVTTNNLTISGASTATTGALTKSGAGTLTLSGANLHTGLTTVSAGTLRVSGSMTGSMVAVNNGGTFGGTGTVTTNNQSFTLASGAKLDPGTNAGTGLSIATGSSTLDISAGVSGANTGALLFNLDATTTSDKITLTAGTLAIGSGELNFADFGFTTGGSFGAGTYTLFSSAGLSGTLAGSGLTGTLAGFDATLGLSGNDIVLTTVAVPEPSSLLSLFAGVGCLLGLHRVRGRTRHGAMLPQ
jgi:fibronectin-binding autotransporter adhesin